MLQKATFFGQLYSDIFGVARMYHHQKILRVDSEMLPVVIIQIHTFFTFYTVLHLYPFIYE